MDLEQLGEWIFAVARAEQEEVDNQMQMLAWQTALLMNSTGNFKKEIKPSDLYTPMADSTQNKPEYSAEDKKKLQEELLSTFSNSDIVIQ